MHRALLERRIRDVHARLVRAREDLAVLDEQLAVVMESADEARCARWWRRLRWRRTSTAKRPGTPTPWPRHAMRWPARFSISNTGRTSSSPTWPAHRDRREGHRG